MMKYINAACLLFVLSFAVLGQSVSPSQKAEADEKLQKETLEFLRETAGEVGNMRSAENRLSFNAELASLMWFRDEKESRAMYSGVISDFRQLLSQYDNQLNMMGTPGADEDTGNLITGGSGRSSLERKFRVALSVRQQIAMSLAVNQPELAYSFYLDSTNLITNAERRKEIETSDRSFEHQLIAKIAQSDAAKGVKYGLDTLKAGLDQLHVELLKTIYTKDAEKGVEFGAAVLSKLKTDRSKIKGPNIYSGLLNFGSDTLATSKRSGGKKAVYSENDLRDIADMFAQMLLDSREDEGFSPLSWVDDIGKYTPARAMQIRARFKAAKSETGLSTGGSTGIDGPTSTGPEVGPDGAPVKPVMVAEEKSGAEGTDVFEKITGLTNRKLPDDERAKVIAEARRIIAKTPGREGKITALSMLAAQVAKAGDRELAAEIMRDAERMVNPQPKNYRDYLLTWMLITGYAEADPDKAFRVLDDIVGRVNETITAFVKVGEFIDTNDEMIDDGEVQVGAFGGGMVAGLTGELGIATGTLRSLAIADLARTRAVTNRFDRTEIRVLAKMMVLRAILDDSADQTSDAVKKEQASVETN